LSEKRSGLLLLHKVPGTTSFQDLRLIKKRLGHGKVGHAGTLDKFAEGLLIVACGRYTRLLSLFEALDKTYEARLLFGTETETLDPEGEPTRRSDIPTYGEVEGVLPSFMGRIEQLPPRYSAIHVGGKRAYDLARRGEDFQVPSRVVEIKRLEVIRAALPELDVIIDCSKGTYIRSLARDIARGCGAAAHLSKLKRLSIGPFSLDEGVKAEDFDPERHLMSPESFLERLDQVEIMKVQEEVVPRLRQGRKINATWFLGEPKKNIVALFDQQQNFLALIERHQDGWVYRMVIPEAAL